MIGGGRFDYDRETGRHGFFKYSVKKWGEATARASKAICCSCATLSLWYVKISTGMRRGCQQIRLTCWHLLGEAGASEELDQEEA